MGRSDAADGPVAASLDELEPIRRGYEQVAAQLRQQIEGGGLPPGSRLPSEATLARKFQTSRQTLREALRLLSAWGLVRSEPGRGGGTFVAYPDIAHTAEVVRSSIARLTSGNSISLEQLLEVRVLLEVPAAGFAAERATEQALLDIRQWILRRVDKVAWREQAACNIRFHLAILAAAQNPVLLLAEQPLVVVLSERFAQIPHDEIREQTEKEHEQIYEAILAGDASLARQEMVRHLESVRPYYASADRG